MLTPRFVSLTLALAGLAMGKDLRQQIVTVTVTSPDVQQPPGSTMSPAMAPSVPPPAPPPPAASSAAASMPAAAPPASSAAMPMPLPSSAAGSIPFAPPATSAMPMPMPSGSSVPSFSGPNCGRGYTYCGYMLTSGGHNFDMATVNKTYNAGMEQNGAKFRTDPQQAVFLCMSDEPNATIQLLCACDYRCLNEKSTNNIAHCEKPCIQSCNGPTPGGGGGSGGSISSSSSPPGPSSALWDVEKMMLPP